MSVTTHHLRKKIMKKEFNSYLFKSSRKLLKYVNVDGKYYFGRLNQDHSKIIPNTLKATSAGFIYYETLSDESRWMKVTKEHSMTLELGPLPEDEKNIATLLGYGLMD